MASTLVHWPSVLPWGVVAQHFLIATGIWLDLLLLSVSALHNGWLSPIMAQTHPS